MLEDIIKDRKKKLARLREAGIDPYPPKAARTTVISDVLEKFGELEQSKKKVSVAGRVMAIRDQGGVAFLDVKDESGQIQAVLKNDNLKNFDLIKSALDCGDFVSVAGPLFETKRGEKSVEAKEIAIISKSLRPLPDKWHGLEDLEERLRRRYLDLLINPEVKDLFRKKAIFWETFRDRLKKKGFLEIEMPVFEAVPGGADAEPFITHHDALGTDFYLRISLELPLKKLLVGGFEKIFEIGRVFRNEGIDREHLQDYTQLEFYWAYHDYNDLMDLVEDMYKAVVKNVCGGMVTSFQGQKIDWEKEWPKIDYVDAFGKENGFDPLSASNEDLAKKAKSLGVEVYPGMGRGRLTDLIFKKTVRPKLIEPAFLIDPPVEVVPLAKRLEGDPRRAARMQPVACGTELGTGYTELNDPLDQRARFEEQMKLREAGDKEAQRLDEEFLTALEYGMPPAAGFGVSERFFAVLMDKSVRETVFFPLMRPKNK